MAKDTRETSLVIILARLTGDVVLTYLAATTRKLGVHPLHLSWSQMPGGGRHNTITLSCHVPELIRTCLYLALGLCLVFQASP